MATVKGNPIWRSKHVYILQLKMISNNFKVSFLILHSIVVTYFTAYGHESGGSVFSNNESRSARKIRYVFYDVNPPEGFNLRRDVYIRMTGLILELQKSENWVLVLPPWPRLYHWRSDIDQERLPWGQFFDVPSLQKFAPVIEFLDFLDMQPSGVIDQVYVLQHFEEMFKTGVFEDGALVQNCSQPLNYKKSKNGLYRGNFWGFAEISARNVDCLSFHGHASFIAKIIAGLSPNTIMLDHAEVALHDHYGDSVYWRARRSMRFSRALRDIARDFRETFLNSSDVADNTALPDDWTLQKSHRRAIGGPYISVHLRRRDFLLARSTETPSLENAVKQMKNVLKELNLQTVFLSTDAPEREIKELKKLTTAEGIKLAVFRPTRQQLQQIKDGGVAIVDQIIASHARKFIGTFESTFSYRIQEEREILGFKPETTFNRLCGDGVETCEQPAQWLIRY